MKQRHRRRFRRRRQQQQRRFELFCDYTDRHFRNYVGDSISSIDPKNLESKFDEFKELVARELEGSDELPFRMAAARLRGLRLQVKSTGPS